MNTSEIKIALVGAGYMAAEHARALNAWPGVRIVGICGRARQRAEALAAAYGAEVFDSIDKMYSTTEADVVVVAVNELSMATVFEQVFAHRWAVLLEKPVGLNLSATRRTVEMARGRRVWVALNRRAFSATRAALEQLLPDSGPRLISVLDQQNMTDAAGIGHPAEVVENWMFANSIHLVDYFRTFGRGRIVEVRHAEPWRAEAPRHLLATLQFDSGDIGVYQAVWDGPGPWAVAVTDQRVRVELRPLERIAIQRRGERRHTELPADARDSDFKPGLHRLAGWLLEELAGGHTPLPTLHEALESTELVARIYGLEQVR
jgi:predicted dehydrogenase